MEILSIEMDLASASKDIQPLKNLARPPPSHILFADDVLIFCRGNKKSIHGVRAVFSNIQSYSGLIMSLEKSKIYLSKRVKDKLNIANSIGIPLGHLPIRYLGVPLSASYPKAVHFQPLIDACRKRLESWNCKVLSKAGKAQLISTVLQNVANFWIQTFKLPLSVMRKLESMFSSFFWGKNIRAEKWSLLCKPKKEGGLNLRSISEMNNAAGIKLLWTVSQKNSLWASYMRDIYIGSSGGILEASPSVYDSGSWKFILKARDKALGSILQNINGTPVWTSSNNYNFKFFWSHICEHAPQSTLYKSVWFPNHCPKMSFCLLRAVKDTLPTKSLLLKRTMQVDPLCVLCNNHQESAEHLFFKCNYTVYIWSVCRLKLELQQKQEYSLAEEIMDFQVAFTKKSGIRLLARLIIPTTVWHIWKERNDRIFNGREKDKRHLLLNIQMAVRTLCTDEPKGGQGKRIMENWL